MLFNKTAAGVPVVEPILTSDALLQRCQYVFIMLIISHLIHVRPGFGKLSVVLRASDVGALAPTQKCTFNTILVRSLDFEWVQALWALDNESSTQKTP
jgi:hypothetical protein